MARLLIHDPDVREPRSVGLQQLRTTIGRGKANGVALPDDQRVSLCHASIRRTADGYLLSDEDSTNGTLVNGEPVAVEHRLVDGDEIVVGETVMRFRTGRSA